MTLIVEKTRVRKQNKQAPPVDVIHTRMNEAVALCPKCKAFQTVSFVENRLVETRKFIQKDGQVYHDCGSEEPCRLYRAI